jgi:hypothetical protein
MAYWVGMDPHALGQAGELFDRTGASSSGPSTRAATVTQDLIVMAHELLWVPCPTAR